MWLVAERVNRMRPRSLAGRSEQTLLWAMKQAGIDSLDLSDSEHEFVLGSEGVDANRSC